MPACFQLFPKNDPTKAAALSQVDDAMCAHFQVEPDPVRYYHWWFDSIGYRLATGKTFDEIRKEYVSYREEDRLAQRDESVHARLIEIVDWLDENYSPNSFYSRYNN
jgi:hypothetical protein